MTPDHTFQPLNYRLCYHLTTGWFFQDVTYQVRPAHPPDIKMQVAENYAVDSRHIILALDGRPAPDSRSHRYVRLKVGQERLRRLVDSVMGQLAGHPSPMVRQEFHLDAIPRRPRPSNRPAV